MSINPRKPESLDHVRLFDKGCVESRLHELTTQFIQLFVKQDLEGFAMEYKKAFKAVPIYPYDSTQLRERFNERARGEALRILEQERQAYVDYHSERFKRRLEALLKRLRYLVFIPNEKGKLAKAKQFIERALLPDHSGNYVEKDMVYVGDHDFQRLHEISALHTRLSAFRDYAQYFSEDLKLLWEETTDLATLEIVRKDEKEQKKSGIESMENKAARTTTRKTD